MPLASVGTAELKDGSVTSGKIQDGSLRAEDFALDGLARHRLRLTEQLGTLGVER